MGRVTVAAKIENVFDLYEVSRGQLQPDQVRSVEVTDALVDTGAFMLGLPKKFIVQLGLQHLRSRQARTAGGVVTFQIYGTVRFTIQGRDDTCDVLELTDDMPVLIGQIPLEQLDWVVDPIGQRLIGNPEHGGQQMVDVF